MTGRRVSHSPHRLSFEERERITRGIAAGESGRAIARGLGRAPSTVCREIGAGGGRGGIGRSGRSAGRSGGRGGRRRRSCRRARRWWPRSSAGLELGWSPQQISATLQVSSPMIRGCVSVTRRSICRCMCSPRASCAGGLTAQLADGAQHSRKPRGRQDQRGRMIDMVNIIAAPGGGRGPGGPGHWEGDLIVGGLRPLGGRDAGRAPDPVCDARLSRQRDCRTERVIDALEDAGSAGLPGASEAVADLGSGQRAGRATGSSPSIPACRSTSATRARRGSAAATRTPTGCCASTSRRAPTSRSMTRPRWTGSRPCSTAGPQTLGLDEPGREDGRATRCRSRAPRDRLSDHRRYASPYGLGSATTVANPVHPAARLTPRVALTT